MSNIYDQYNTCYIEFGVDVSRLTASRYSSLFIIAKALPYLSLRPVTSWLHDLTRQEALSCRSVSSETVNRLVLGIQIIRV